VPALSSTLRAMRRRWRLPRTARPPEEEGGDPHGRFVIAFANSPFEGRLRLDELDGPPGVRFTSRKSERAGADVVVFHLPTLVRLPRIKPAGQRWVAWSLESVVNYPELDDPAFMARFDVTMTYRLSADVPIPYTVYYRGVDLLAGLRQRVDPGGRELVASLISSRIDHSDRIRWQRELAELLPLHCYGRVGRNREIPVDRGRASKHEILRGYRFALAFENSIAPDYVTEKFFDALIAGAVPVYLGAPNVEDFAPGDRCYLSVRDFSSPRELAAYLRHLADDEADYRELHAWRSRPLRPTFLRLVELADRSPPFVRLAARLSNGRG